jgi:hypothetical protein
MSFCDLIDVFGKKRECDFDDGFARVQTPRRKFAEWDLREENVGVL